MNGKQRSYLKGLAQNLRPLSQVGKEGITDAYIADLDLLLENHELVKIAVLENHTGDMDETLTEIIEKTDSEFVQKIGRKIVIYRQSRTKPEIEIPGADNRRVQAYKQKQKARKGK